MVFLFKRSYLSKTVVLEKGLKNLAFAQIDSAHNEFSVEKLSIK